MDKVEEGDSVYVDTAANVVQALLPSNPKLRWEELDEFPYLSETMMALETLYQEKPLELVHGGLLSPEVTYHLLSFSPFLLPFYYLCL
jgi:hypothetical protein